MCGAHNLFDISCRKICLANCLTVIYTLILDGGKLFIIVTLLLLGSFLSEVAFNENGKKKLVCSFRKDTKFYLDKFFSVN